MLYRLGMYLIGLGMTFRRQDECDVASWKKLSIDMDLSGCAIEDALEHAKRECFGGRPTTLICTPGDSIEAARLAERYGFRVIALPLIPADAWALCWDYGAIYSEGA